VTLLVENLKREFHRLKPRTHIVQDYYACIYLVKGSGTYNRARHIHARVYRIRELASKPSPEVRLFNIVGEDQPSDIYTKGLPRPAFENHWPVLMGVTPKENLSTGRQTRRSAIME